MQPSDAGFEDDAKVPGIGNLSAEDRADAGEAVRKSIDAAIKDVGRATFVGACIKGFEYGIMAVSKNKAGPAAKVAAAHGTRLLSHAAPKSLGSAITATAKKQIISEYVFVSRPQLKVPSSGVIKDSLAILDWNGKREFLSFPSAGNKVYFVSVDEALGDIPSVYNSRSAQFGSAKTAYGYVEEYLKTAKTSVLFQFGLAKPQLDYATFAEKKGLSPSNSIPSPKYGERDGFFTTNSKPRVHNLSFGFDSSSCLKVLYKPQPQDVKGFEHVFSDSRPVPTRSNTDIRAQFVSGSDDTSVRQRADSFPTKFVTPNDVKVVDSLPVDKVEKESSGSPASTDTIDSKKTI
jgi:hypothetical protein